MLHLITLLENKHFLSFEEKNVRRIDMSFNGKQIEANIYEVGDTIVRRSVILNNDNCDEFLRNYNLLDKIEIEYNNYLDNYNNIYCAVSTYMNELFTLTDDEYLINLFRRFFDLLACGETFYLSDTHLVKMVQGLDKTKVSFQIFVNYGNNKYSLNTCTVNMFIRYMLEYYYENQDILEKYILMKEYAEFDKSFLSDLECPLR